MKKITKNNFSVSLIVVILFSVVVVYFVLRAVNMYQPASSNLSLPIGKQNSSQIFKSKNLKFTIDVPSKFRIEEKFTTVFLRNTLGEILVDRIGTNFSNIDDYLEDLSIKNKLLIEKKNKFLIDNYNSMNVVIKHPVSKDQDSKAYMIYVDYFIYTFSTTYPDLFDDLDQIAKSFRYSP